jgi:hypothetical protein
VKLDNSPKALLTTFGGVLFVSNTFLYLTLHNYAKWHGAAQAGLAFIGAVCLIIAFFLKDNDNG